MPDTSHLIERAAARLREGGAAAGAGDDPLANRPPLLPGPAAADAGIAGGLSGRDSGGNGSAGDAWAEHGLAGAQGGEAVPGLNGSRLPAGPLLTMAQLAAGGLVTAGAARSIASEELWLVQRQILGVAFRKNLGHTAMPGNLVMVTSARPGEGKSFTALNLAASIARQGDHSVLLVDLDPKRSSLTSVFELSSLHGALDLAGGGATDLARAICGTELPGLSFLPVGQPAAGAADQLGRRQTWSLLQGLARQVPERLVILDTAPCLSLGDAPALSPIVGQIVFVVEAERTQKRDIESGLALLQECPNVAVLLNKSRRSGLRSQRDDYYRRYEKT